MVTWLQREGITPDVLWLEIPVDFAPNSEAAKGSRAEIELYFSMLKVSNVSEYLTPAYPLEMSQPL